MSSRIIFRVPIDVISGLITVKTASAQAISSSGLDIIAPDIIVRRMLNLSGSTSGIVSLSGSNFTRIDNVYFYPNIGAKYTIGGDLINTTIPEQADWGYITVKSDIRNTSGQSPYKFVPTPIITGFSPLTGISGKTITILGNYFSGVTGCYVNEISVTGLKIVSKTQIITYIPSGNVDGYIKIFGPSGVNAISPNRFSSQVDITGLHILSGRTGDFQAISGGWQTGYLNHLGDGYFKVAFGEWNISTGFKLRQEPNKQLTLTGIIPETATSGFVYIYKPDGVSTHHTTFQFNKLYERPVISDFSPDYQISGQFLNMRIQGGNLKNIQKIVFTGVTFTGSYGFGFTVPTGETGRKYIREDYFGTLTTISNYPLTGTYMRIGYYDFDVFTNAGSGGNFEYQVRPFEVASGFHD